MLTSHSSVLLLFSPQTICHYLQHCDLSYCKNFELNEQSVGEFHMNSAPTLLTNTVKILVRTLFEVKGSQKGKMEVSKNKDFFSVFLFQFKKFILNLKNKFFAKSNLFFF